MESGGLVEKVLKESGELLHSEELILEAVRDLMKDEVKGYIRETLDKNPELKAELKAAIAEMFEAKLREGYALIKLAKCSAKLGIQMVPEPMRKELTGALVSMFEKELNALLDRSL